MNNKIQSKVLSVSNVTDSAYVLRLERNGFEFKAGQYLVLSIPGERKAREYSIYSSESDNYIELLIKEVDPGEMSRQLKYLKVGAKVEISGPFGYFILSNDAIVNNIPVVFVATGTGISPFRSIIRSNPELNYKVLHGVRYKTEAYHFTDYKSDRYQLCSSRENGIGYNGRVTDYIAENGVSKNALYYLCGNSAMINDVTDLLEEHGVLPDQIKTEVFF
ncbi:MAG TPA: FAD-binding oxidoreductase [Prolixibacteraceae bacterium]|nr:FAD-binding oxidoreductase [Prolixibacteraceae bacterium]